MATTNYERVGKAMELLREGLLPFVTRELQGRHGKYWITKVTETWQNELVWCEGEDLPQLDVAALLRMMWDQWNLAFKDTLGFSERSLGSQAETARELAYRLYTVCERKKRAAEALSYNGLVQSWPEITRLAREGSMARPAQGQLFGQGEQD